jgi:predicted nucleic acid-binding protein
MRNSASSATMERFVDTSEWAEYFDVTLQFHSEARAAFEEVWDQGGRLVTTSLVLAELTALLTRPLRVTKPRQIQLLGDIRSDPSVEVVHIDPSLDADAWRLWESRPDKDWSLVDCASFVVMTRRGLVEALTTDHHFEQAGFVRLLK